MPPKHTPGEWQIIQESPNAVIRDITALTDDDEILIASAHGVYVSQEQLAANAKLIADAPELLRILDRAIKQLADEHYADKFKEGCGICQTLREADALLRKHGYGPEPDAPKQERSNATNDRSTDE